MTPRPCFRLNRMLLYLAALLGVLCAALPASGAEEAKVRFQWAFGAVIAADGDSKLVSVTGDMDLKTGDQLKFFIRPESEGFVYLFYLSSQGELMMLFPDDLGLFEEKAYGEDGRYYVPRGDSWFKLDANTGLERFYLLASAERLTELERLWASYEAAGEAKKPALAKSFVEKVRKIRRARRSFTARAERPVSIGGNLRGYLPVEGSYPDVAEIATVISADDFFARTFTIDHR